jgi:flavin reductase (DIM6/NTAB) family NADH-FMN oxidoreductase RutF
MAKVSVEPFRSVYPTPAALVTCVSPEGKPNIIALGEVFNVSLRKPPVIGLAIRRATWSHGLIAETKEFVINFPTSRMVRQTEICGSTSGRDTDKFAAASLTPLPADKVRPPLIAECPVNLECRLISLQDLGDHDLFLGEVLVAHADQELLDAEGRVAPERLDPLIFMFNFGHPGEYWSLGSWLGKRGR